MDLRTSTIITVAGITVFGGVLAYATYFDYKRRNDAAFRKKLRKDKKRVDKSIAQSRETLSSTLSGQDVTEVILRNALEEIKKEDAPRTPEEKESYFMAQVEVGERLSRQGPDFYVMSAKAFYRALRVYPSPVELIVIYEKTVPQPIFKIVMDMTNLDVKARVEGYYDAFPPKSTNTKIETREGRKVAIATKDISAGEVIYKEFPIVAVLDPDIQAAGTHCAHCFRVVSPSTVIILPAEANPLSSKFCSDECRVANSIQSHSLLFTTESPLPDQITANPISTETLKVREVTQANFVEYIKKVKRARPLLVARFIARQVAVETSKMFSGKVSLSKNDYLGADTEYLLADHMERLRFLEIMPPVEELPLLVALLQTALPGLEQFVTRERHATLVGKMAYNAIGVCFGVGRDDKPLTDGRPEDMERTRTPCGTSKQIGSAFYILSSYLSHSCTPSVRPSFDAGTVELHLVANRNLKEGEELSMAFVDVLQNSGESVAECRQRRRTELARGWKFACSCSRCIEEEQMISKEEVHAGESSESKLDPILNHFKMDEDCGESILI